MRGLTTHGARCAALITTLMLAACQSQPTERPNTNHRTRRPIETRLHDDVQNSPADIPQPRIEFPSGHPWSPDGKRLILGQRIIDIEARRVVLVPCGECCGLPVWSRANRIVFDCGEGSLLFDVDTNRLRSVARGFQTAVLRRGTELAWTNRESDGNQTRQLWAIDRGVAIGDPLPSPVETIWETSSDGESAISIAPSGETALVRLASGERTVVANDATFNAVPPEPFSLFSPDSSMCAIPRRGRSTLLVDVKSHREIGELSEPKCEDASNVDWSADGTLIVVGNGAGEVCLFETATRSFLHSWNVARPGKKPSGGATPAASDSLMEFTMFMPNRNAIIAGPDAEMAGPGCGYAAVFPIDAKDPIADLGLVCRLRPAANGAVVYEVFGSPTRMIAADLAVVPDGVSHFSSAGEVSDDGKWVIFPGARREGTFAGEKATAVNTLTHQVVLLEDWPNGDRLLGQVVIDPTSSKLLGECMHGVGVWDIATGHLVLSVDAP
jgi:hypothetical protein